jgi:hypothetical protein
MRKNGLSVKSGKLSSLLHSSSAIKTSLRRKVKFFFLCRFFNVSFSSLTLYFFAVNDDDVSCSEERRRLKNVMKHGALSIKVKLTVYSLTEERKRSVFVGLQSCCYEIFQTQIDLCTVGGVLLTKLHKK